MSFDKTPTAGRPSPPRKWGVGGNGQPRCRQEAGRWLAEGLSPFEDRDQIDFHFGWRYDVCVAYAGL
jgi:hypothetical protein